LVEVEYRQGLSEVTIIRHPVFRWNPGVWW
jgi:hypothetical protein